MPHPVTIFDSPPCNLQPDVSGPRWYANVDNRLEVNIGGRPYTIAIAVPTELFTFLKEVAKVSPEEDVTLSLDKIDGRYVFAALAGDSLHDLWYYSDASLPRWIRDRSRAL